MNIQNTLMVLCCLSFSSTLLAMRCGTQLVEPGDNQFNIIEKCGEPKDKQQFTEVTPLYNAAGYQIGSTTNEVERWIYQRSTADFQYTLTFDAGILKTIDTDRNP